MFPDPSAGEDETTTREFRCVECKTTHEIEKPGLSGDYVTASCSECHSITLHRVTEGPA